MNTLLFFIKQFVYLLALLVALTACSSYPSRSVSTLDYRQQALSADECAEHYSRINRRLNMAADIRSSKWQVGLSDSLDRFDTSLFRDWMQAASTGRISLYTRTKGFPFAPHIMNYDLMGDIYYYGCKAEKQSALDKAWSGDRSGTQPNFEKAAKHYEFAAIGHVPRSQYRFGRMLLAGQGIEKDESMGIQWITSAAIEGHNEARRFMRSLGLSVPEEISPNTFSRLAQNERARQLAWSRSVQERQRRTRQTWGELLQLSLAAFGAYYSGANSATGPSDLTGSNYPSDRLQQRPVLRVKPSYCYSNVTVNVSGGDYAIFANGVITTFCY
ncbi:sel1 repeat family protein [Wenzhouxiangella sp. XN201]|uniref:tetratricopeptide repeat protein n=1 Tax=Wenzhouxiangella sp. XN201 TaxID=2710755 RepID=UPI0013CB82A8|nr:sel1 repeat family protein [Wenzhouxiangella sp. XN201]NEZ02810.1 sel1 repeat family protein [Wenzhouxiangella sp. XN201]